MRQFTIVKRSLAVLLIALTVGCGGASESESNTPADRIAKAKEMPDPATRATTLINIARELSETGAVAELKDATYLAKLACPDIKDPRRRAEATTEVADLLIEQGDKTEARGLLRDVDAALKEIDDPLERVSAVSKVAPTYANKLSRKSRAQEMLDEVRGELENIEDSTFRISAMCDVSGAMDAIDESETGDQVLSEAVAYAEGLEDARKRCDGLAEIGLHMDLQEYGSGKDVWGKAEEAADAIEDANSRAFAWVGLLKGYRKTGDRDAAGKAFSNAQKSAGKINDQSQKNRVNQELDRLRQ